MAAQPVGASRRRTAPDAYPVAAQSLQCRTSEIVTAHSADHLHPCAITGGGHSLIGPLASMEHGHSRADYCFPFQRKAGYGKDKIDINRTKNDDHTYLHQVKTLPFQEESDQNRCEVPVVSLAVLFLSI